MTMTLAKVCMMGDISVGKTSLVQRYVDRSYSDSYLSTVGVKISRKSMALPDPEGGVPATLQLVLWDLEGGSAFHQVADSYLKGARAGLIVADVTRAETIESVPLHIKHFLGVNPRAFVMVALNKVDLLTDQPMDGAPWVGMINVLHTAHTSAKTGDGVDDLFEQLAMRLMRDAVDRSPH